MFTEIPLDPAFIVYSMAFYTRLNGTLGYFLSKAFKNGFTCLQRMKVIQVIVIHFEFLCNKFKKLNRKLFVKQIITNQLIILKIKQTIAF